ncbi:MAG: glutamate mutase L, partial [Anaerolineae bacterium]|nr:glutamate mutase L [Anaerolineae bacterium]
IIADVGSTSSILVGGFGDDVSTRISTRSGLGQSAPLLLELLGEEAVANWLPFVPAQAEIQNYALNKSIRPASIPISLRDFYLEMAFLREALRMETRESLYQWPGTEAGKALPAVAAMVISGGALANTGNPFLSMMLAADGLQPTGVTKMYADPYAFASVFAPIGRINPEAAVQLVDSGALVDLGTLISIDGYAVPDRTVARLRITTSDGEKINYELKGGHLLSLPLPANYSLTLQIRTVGAHRIGGKSRMKITLSGGAGGILIDARGRNFEPAATVAERARWLPLWIHEATDEPLQEIPAEWIGAGAMTTEASAQPADLMELAGFNDEDFMDEASEQKKKDDELNEELGSLRDLL